MKFERSCLWAITSALLFSSFLLQASYAIAQERGTVRGTVVNANNEPAAGVTVALSK